MSVTAVHSFIERLKDDAFRTQLAPSLRKVREGNWEAVSVLAAQYGFEFTADELKAAMKHYPGFFKGAGQQPHAGWNKRTLENR